MSDVVFQIQFIYYPKIMLEYFKMNKFEYELARISNTLNRIQRLSLLGKKLEIHGQQNIIYQGPNLIVGNHIGSFKDIAVLFNLGPRTFYFTANEMIFNKAEFNGLIKKHLKRHLKEFGVFIFKISSPLRGAFVDFISSNIGKIGTIPVNLEGSKRHAIVKCQEYVSSGKAVVLLQGRGRIIKEDSNPYVHPFRRGPAIISYNLYTEKGISVPVTPVAIFGTHLPYIVPGKIKINIGKPIFIKDYLSDGFELTIERFRAAMEKKVKLLLLELIRA